MLNKGLPIEFDSAGDQDEVSELERFPIRTLALEKRRGSFEEVNLGYHKLRAIAEAMRCLHCERRQG